MNAEKNTESTGISYSSSGVDIATADAAKLKMAESLKTKNPRVLNCLGAFASLYDGTFSDCKQPVLVMKMEEPGSKQKLAFTYGYVPSLCRDLVNHLVNDIAVMGAEPHAVQDVIVCGKLESQVVTEIVKHMSLACRDLDCELVGGETSEQPGVLEAGSYVLAASVVGVVDKSKILDGSKTAAGDVVFAVASNGLHTNGYSLARKLLELKPQLKDELVEGKSFLDQIMLPHTPYLMLLRDLRDLPGIKGFAHITGGGIEGNLNRILPAGLNAEIDPTTIKILPIFKKIQQEGQVPEADMRKTFNMGVGLAGICSEAELEKVLSLCKKHNLDAYPIGRIISCPEGTKDQTVVYL